MVSLYRSLILINTISKSLNEENKTIAKRVTHLDNMANP